MATTNVTDRHGDEQSSLRIELSADRPDGVLVVRVSGPITRANCPTFDHYLHAKLPWRTGHVVLDFSDVTLLSAAGIRVLTRYVRRLSIEGHGCSLAAVRQQVRRVLEVAGTAGIFTIHDSVSLAAVSHSGQPVRPTAAVAPPPDQDDPLARAADEVLYLRATAHTKPIVARAVGVVQGRYGIDNADHALQLLSRTAKEHHVPLIHLARTLLATPAPGGVETWKADRPEPLLTFYIRPAAHHANQVAVVASFLDTAVKYMDTTMGALHLADPLGNGVYLGQQHGLPDRLAYHLVDPQAAHQTAVAAQTSRTRITIPDVSDTTTARTLITERTRHLLVRLGIRALQCTPLLTSDRQCAGTITTYHHDIGHTPSKPACAKLDQAGTELADWLAWNQDTTTRDALGRLHRRAAESAEKSQRAR